MKVKVIMDYSINLLTLSLQPENDVELSKLRELKPIENSVLDAEIKKLWSNRDGLSAQTIQPDSDTIKNYNELTIITFHR